LIVSSNEHGDVSTNCPLLPRLFKGQYEVNKAHQKTVKICQENEKLWGYYIGLYPY
jgi:hypothetical protein